VSARVPPPEGRCGVVSPGRVLDIYEAAGLEKPDIALLSEEFLEDVKRLPYKNLQLELLKKLLADEIRTVGQRNLVTVRKFSELLTKSILNYQNRSLTSAEVIAELVELAKQLQAERDRGTKLKLNEAELAVYDAISTCSEEC
jgi:type I restriction enzyme, R subunit